MLLTEKLPLNHEFEFEDRIFEIDMSFNNILTIFELIEDNSISNAQKIVDSLYLLTGVDDFDMAFLNSDENIEFAQSLLEAIFGELLTSDTDNDYAEGYYTDIYGNKFKPQKKEDNKNQEEQPSYCFIHDAKYIYAGFLQTYNMDLYKQHGKLHWEHFLALLESLPDDTKFNQVIDIRTRDLPTGKGTEKEREELLKLKNIYKLPESEVDEWQQMDELQ